MSEYPKPYSSSEILSNKIRNFGRFLIGNEPIPLTGRQENVVRVAGRDPFSPPPELEGEELFEKAREYEQDRRKLAGEI